MSVYFNDWKIYNLLREHVKWLHLILECCRQIQLALNTKTCILTKPIGILLGHVARKVRIKIDLTNIKVILNLKPPVKPK